MNVHQLLSGAGPHDAITTEALVFRSYFERWGWGGGDYAARIAPGLGTAVVERSRLRPDPDDVVLIHHSAGTTRLHEVLELPNPKLFLYHNVTPASWLWAHAPLVAAQCAIGREQLPELIAATQLAAADSQFNADELRALGAEGPAVIPLLIEHARLGEPGRSDGRAARAPTILFVGRLSPHKRQDEVIRCFALYRRHRAPDAHLVLVGDPIDPRYLDHLRALAERLAPGAVTIESGLSPQALGEHYRRADAFLCLSEHEGFCIPMLEAFHFGVPVVARPEGAIPETVGDAALLVSEADRAVIAELLHLAVTDEELRAELQARGQRRLEAFAAEDVAGRLRDAVEETTARARAVKQPRSRSVIAVT